MALEFVFLDNLLVARPSGKLHGSVARRLQEIVESVCGARGMALVLNLAGCESIDSVGVHVVADAVRRGIDVRLVSPSLLVEFELARNGLLQRKVLAFSSEEHAIRNLAARGHGLFDSCPEKTGEPQELRDAARH